MIQYSKSVHPELNKRVQWITWIFYFAMIGAALLSAHVFNLGEWSIRAVLITAGIAVTLYFINLNSKHSKIKIYPM